MITAKSIFLFFTWICFVVAISFVFGMLLLETFSSIVGLNVMDKAGLAKDTSKLMWSWIQVKPFVLLGLGLYVVFFSKPSFTWFNLGKKDKPKDA